MVWEVLTKKKNQILFQYITGKLKTRNPITVEYLVAIELLLVVLFIMINKAL